MNKNIQKAKQQQQQQQQQKYKKKRLSVDSNLLRSNLVSGARAKH